MIRSGQTAPNCSRRSIRTHAMGARLTGWDADEAQNLREKSVIAKVVHELFNETHKNKNKRTKRTPGTPLS